MEKKVQEYALRSKALKQKGRKVVKEHYWFLIVTCLFAAFLGSEFTDAVFLTSSDGADVRALISIPSEIADGTASVFGSTNGVFASVIKQVTSGSINATIVGGISNVIGSEVAAQYVLVGLALLGTFLVWLFVGNIYQVISRRIFLESRIYKKVSLQKYLFLFYIKEWGHVTRVMFVKYVYHVLWYLVFLIGGMIKYYSYFLVPYILAENPTLSAKEAITLSRKMMYGYKWKCFVIQVSFLGWSILDFITLGLAGLFYSNAYRAATYVEFYVNLRALAKENNIPGAELLNDKYLYEKADELTLASKYEEVYAILHASKTEVKKPEKFYEKALDFLGLTLHRSQADEQRELEIIKETGAKEYEEILAGEEYPLRLFTVPGRSKNAKKETVNYMRKYTIPSVVLLFFIFSFIGWSWEVALHLVNDGKFVNRGIMQGPWLPIYGSGGVMILLLLNKLRKKVWIQFFSAVVLCGIVEYFTAYYLEITHDGKKWWDYSGYFINLHGRICGEGLLVFGLGGIGIVYVLAPLLDDYITKINHKVLITISCILITLFVADQIYSSKHPNEGEGITAGSHAVIEIEDIEFEI